MVATVLTPFNCLNWWSWLASANTTVTESFHRLPGWRCYPTAYYCSYGCEAFGGIVFNVSETGLRTTPLVLSLVPRTFTATVLTPSLLMLRPLVLASLSRFLVLILLPLLQLVIPTTQLDTASSGSPLVALLVLVSPSHLPDNSSYCFKKLYAGGGVSPPFFCFNKMT